MTEEGRKKLMDTCDKVLMIDRTIMNDPKFYLTSGASVTDPKFYQEVERVLYDIIDLENDAKRKSDLLKDQQAEIERLKEKRIQAVKRIEKIIEQHRHSSNCNTMGMVGGLRIAVEIIGDEPKDCELEWVKPFHRCDGSEYTLIEDSHFNFCPYCGKPIDWNEGEHE